MNNQKNSLESHHYVKIDDELCNGCVLCMKACPTKAIRVRKDGVAHIEGDCIDCGNCIRVCPRGAVKAITTGSAVFKLDRYTTAASVSPVLYAQFGDQVLPNDVLLALKGLFSYVYDQSYTQELFNVAIGYYIRENRKEANKPWPLISPICPVVNRIIGYRFPTLLDHIPPIIAPREIVARELKSRLIAKGKYKPEEIQVFHITPCSAKMISINEPIFLKHSNLDGAIGISEIYDIINKQIPKIDEDTVLHHSSGVGIGWAMSGGEVAGLDVGNNLAVSGMQETIRYLEKIEMGLLNDIEYVEFRACPEGCIGGPLTVKDKYQAKHTLQRLVRMFGVEKRVKYAYVKKLYQDGWFYSNSKKMLLEKKRPSLSIQEGIRRQEKVEDILRLLPKKECGVCGSPDCRTFAEDVIDGRTLMENCIFVDH